MLPANQSLLDGPRTCAMRNSGKGQAPAPANRRRRVTSSHIRKRVTPLLYVLPLILFLTFAFVWPLINSFIFSFHPFSFSEGMNTDEWTLEHYRDILTSELYLDIFARTLKVSVVTACLSAIVAYPIAIYIAGLSGTARNLMMLLYVGPWLVNIAVKAFGWTILLSPSGFINNVIQWLGVTDEPVQLMFNEVGIVIGLFHAHLMFVVLPLTVAVSALDRDLVHAAADLGASRVRIFLQVILPLTLPALIAGVVMNFILNMSSFATPALLGGAQAPVVSFVVYRV